MIRNNNPGNIRRSDSFSWVGEEETQSPFCKFKTLFLGYRALLKLLLGYLRRGYNTIDSIINRYAPPSENNTKAYISYICKQLHKQPTDKVNPEELYDFMRAITKMEHSTIKYSENEEAIDDSIYELQYLMLNNKITL